MSVCRECGEALGFGAVGGVCAPCVADRAEQHGSAATTDAVIRLARKTVAKRVVALPADTDARLERVASTRAALLAARGAYSEAVLAASAAGVTQRRIAAAAGVTQQTIQLLLAAARSRD
jgi:hypothetical protein